MVLHADRDVVAGLQAGGPEQTAEAIGGGVEFGEGLREAGVAHDEGGLVGMGVARCAPGYMVAERSRADRAAATCRDSVATECRPIRIVDERQPRSRSTRPRLVLSSAFQPALDEMDCARRRSTCSPASARPPPPTVSLGTCSTTSGSAATADAYYDWRNSCLDRVLDTRVGIPISLSVLMIEVARRVGVPLVGIGMPAHFLVRTVDDPARSSTRSPARRDSTATVPDGSSSEVTTARRRGATRYLNPTLEPRHRDPDAEQPQGSIARPVRRGAVRHRDAAAVGGARARRCRTRRDQSRPPSSTDESPSAREPTTGRELRCAP